MSGAETAAEQGSIFFTNVVSEHSASPRMLIIHEIMGRHCGWLAARTAHKYRQSIRSTPMGACVCLNKMEDVILGVMVGVPITYLVRNLSRERCEKGHRFKCYSSHIKSMDGTLTLSTSVSSLASSEVALEFLLLTEQVSNIFSIQFFCTFTPYSVLALLHSTPMTCPRLCHSNYVAVLMANVPRKKGRVGL